VWLSDMCRTQQAKWKVLQDFRDRKVNILYATEATGMVCFHNVQMFVFLVEIVLRVWIFRTLVESLVSWSLTPSPFGLSAMVMQDGLGNQLSQFCLLSHLFINFGRLSL
jgi:hypothetical protein